VAPSAIDLQKIELKMNLLNIRSQSALCDYLAQGGDAKYVLMGSIFQAVLHPAGKGGYFHWGKTW
jgi:hypothetical protein